MSDPGEEAEGMSDERRHQLGSCDADCAICAEEEEDRTCQDCGGRGSCLDCQGGDEEEILNCETCHGDALCWHCDGTGEEPNA